MEIEGFKNIILFCFTPCYFHACILNQAFRIKMKKLNAEIKNHHTVERGLTWKSCILEYNVCNTLQYIVCGYLVT